ncbi:hypothetical protein HNQ53_002841 [Microbulbifer hydrolyticus]|uniref:Uncharacterized protein n=1 Tax=Microbulbifer hydrolyticus TaxID=48074 RepID=A0AA89PJI9_9GAMM|nr:hypothetical protein [Microbulbifer hydrolyticus]
MPNRFRDFLAEVDVVLGHVDQYGYKPRRVPWGWEPDYPQTDDGITAWEKNAAEQHGTQTNKEHRQ